MEGGTFPSPLARQSRASLPPPRVARATYAAGLVLGVGGFVFGCGDDGATAPDAALTDASSLVSQVVPTALDVLFVVEDQGSIDALITATLSGLPGFIAGLDAIPGGRPQVHFGVVSTNVGAGPFELDGCSAGGDDGRLQNTARVAGCSPPSGYFVSYERDDATLERKNYGGSLEETLACIAHLPPRGCGFEQHLESMKRALDGHRPENTGFVRAEARLAILFIAEEDDCSATDGSLFDPAASELGELSTYRCVEQGISCEGERPPRERADLTGCVADGNAYVRHPDEFVAELGTYKPSPTWITVAGVVGANEPVHVRVGDDGQPHLAAIYCDSISTLQWPAVRLRAFIDAMPNHLEPGDVCRSHGDRLAAIGEGIAEVHAAPCLEGDVEPEGCTSDEAFTLVAAPERCAAYPTGLAVRFDRTGPAQRPSTIVCPQRAR